MMTRYSVLVVAIFMPLQAYAPRTYTLMEMGAIGKMAFACGRAQGMIDAFRESANFEAMDQTKAIWIESKCDEVSKIFADDKGK